MNEDEDPTTITDHLLSSSIYLDIFYLHICLCRHSNISMIYDNDILAVTLSVITQSQTVKTQNI